MTKVATQNYAQILAVIYDIVIVQIGIKLNGTNYALWSQIIKMDISGKY
jgi:hypothetical protein